MIFSSMDAVPSILFVASKFGIYGIHGLYTLVHEEGVGEYAIARAIVMPSM